VASVRGAKDFGSVGVSNPHQKEVQVQVSEYSKRLVELFESGKATEAEKAEMVEAVLSASENGLDNVRAIHKAIGFAEAEKAKRAETRNMLKRFARWEAKQAKLSAIQPSMAAA